MHIAEERSYKLVIAGLSLSESEFAHLSSCQRCIDVFANTTREIVQKRIEKENAAIEAPGNEGGHGRRG